MIENTDFPESWEVGLCSPIFKSGIRWETGGIQGLAFLPLIENVFAISVQKHNGFICEAFNKIGKNIIDK